VRYLVPAEPDCYVGAWMWWGDGVYVQRRGTESLNFSQVFAKVNWHVNSSRVMGRDAWAKLVTSVKTNFFSGE
jgi:hypothetical protein